MPPLEGIWTACSRESLGYGTIGRPQVWPSRIFFFWITKTQSSVVGADMPSQEASLCHGEESRPGDARYGQHGRADHLASKRTKEYLFPTDATTCFHPYRSRPNYSSSFSATHSSPLNMFVIFAFVYGLAPILWLFFVLIITYVLAGFHLTDTRNQYWAL